MANMEIEFKSNKNIVLDSLNERIEMALIAIGMAAETFAKRDCPVDTGRLRNSIGNDHDNRSVIIGSNVEYAPYQELGTSRTHAANGGRGFLRPALEDHVRDYKELTRQALES